MTSDSHEYTVVAMGTGNKCLGKALLSKQGDVIHDSHAEVITRRSFIRYLFMEMQTCLNGKKSIFQYDETSGNFLIQSDLQFHLYVSHAPCTKY